VEAGRAAQGLPKALPTGQVEALLASCDPATDVGRRDAAILTVVSRLVTVEHALAWATLPLRSGWWHAMRLSAVRRFAVHLRHLDDRTEIPPPGLIPHGKHRATPYVYSDAEIRTLVQTAARLGNPVCAATYPVLIGLLAVTGMRFGEAIALDVTDFDPSRPASPSRTWTHH
jgi:integrase